MAVYIVAPSYRPNMDELASILCRHKPFRAARYGVGIACNYEQLGSVHLLELDFNDDEFDTTGATVFYIDTPKESADVEIASRVKLVTDAIGVYHRGYMNSVSRIDDQLAICEYKVNVNESKDIYESVKDAFEKLRGEREKSVEGSADGSVQT